MCGMRKEAKAEILMHPGAQEAESCKGRRTAVLSRPLSGVGAQRGRGQGRAKSERRNAEENGELGAGKDEEANGCRMGDRARTVVEDAGGPNGVGFAGWNRRECGWQMCLNVERSTSSVNDTMDTVPFAVA